MKLSQRKAEQAHRTVPPIAGSNAEDFLPQSREATDTDNLVIIVASTWLPEQWYSAVNFCDISSWQADSPSNISSDRVLSNFSSWKDNSHIEEIKSLSISKINVADLDFTACKKNCNWK